METFSLSVLLYAAVAVVIVLSLSVVYLVYTYRKLLDENLGLHKKLQEKDFHRNMKLDIHDFTHKKIKDSIDKSTQEAVSLIAQNAEKVAKDIRKKSVEKLLADEKGEQLAVAAEYDLANEEIKKYKDQKFAEIKIKANDALKETLTKLLDTLPGMIEKSLTPQDQEELVMKALEDAKRSNIF